MAKGIRVFGGVKAETNAPVVILKIEGDKKLTTVILPRKAAIALASRILQGVQFATELSAALGDGETLESLVDALLPTEKEKSN